MDDHTQKPLREQARSWTCNNLSITDHGGDTVTLLRKLADTISELGNIEILDITYRRPTDPPADETTVTIYYYFMPPE